MKYSRRSVARCNADAAINSPKGHPICTDDTTNNIAPADDVKNSTEDNLTKNSVCSVQQFNDRNE